MSLRRLFTPLTYVFAAVVIMFAAVGTPVLAATNPGDGGGGNGLKVSPVRTDLTVEPGTSQTVSVYVQNVTSAPATLKAVVNDFTASKDEGGQPAVILDENQYAPSHSLKRYIAPIDNVTLQPKQQKEVKVTINIPTGIAGGGYYGAIRFVPVDSGSGQNVNLAASVGSLILVKVPGDIKEDLRLVSFDTRKDDHARTVFTSSNSISAVVRFENKGNIQVEPFGKVVLKNGSGKVLGSYEINDTDPRGNVLPDSIRKFDIALKDAGSFGKYTVEGNFGYGTKGQLLTTKTTFYVIPLAAIIAASVLILLVILAVVVLPRWVRSYNRKVVQKANHRK